MPETETEDKGDYDLTFMILLHHTLHIHEMIHILHLGFPYIMYISNKVPPTKNQLAVVYIYYILVYTSSFNNDTLSLLDGTGIEWWISRG